MKHDFEDQRRETFETFEAIQADNDLPETSIVEFYLLAEDKGCDWSGAERALKTAGYDTERDEEGDTLIVATRKALRIDPATLWAEEKKVTEIGLKFDFVPDGWEFGFDE